MVNSKQLAVLADIHGNRWALEAVLDDIRERGISEVVNLGDALYGPLDPAGTAALLIGLDLPTVCGNEDRIIYNPPPGDWPPTLSYVVACIGSSHIRWLRGLPRTLVIRDDILLFHASPDDDSSYLYWDVHDDGARLRDEADIRRALEHWSQPVVLCGHDHLPRTTRLSDGRMIVNPGSVGLPAYADDKPFEHVMESGSPHARYAVMTASPEGWVVEQRAIPYDWRVAADMARSNGRDDWAQWLLTGEA
jgi:predicted phosphodiesterase